MNYFCVCWSLGYDVKEVDVMVADVSDESSLNAMCSSAEIVLNCVGPVCRPSCTVYLIFIFKSDWLEVNTSELLRLK